MAVPSGKKVVRVLLENGLQEHARNIEALKKGTEMPFRIILAHFRRWVHGCKRFATRPHTGFERYDNSNPRDLAPAGKLFDHQRVHHFRDGVRNVLGDDFVSTLVGMATVILVDRLWDITV